MSRKIRAIKAVPLFSPDLNIITDSGLPPGTALSMLLADGSFALASRVFVSEADSVDAVFTSSTLFATMPKSDKLISGKKKGSSGLHFLTYSSTAVYSLANSSYLGRRRGEDGVGRKKAAEGEGGGEAGGGWRRCGNGRRELGFEATKCYV